MNRIDLRYVLGALRRRAILILTCTLVGFLTTLAAILIVRPEYKSEGRLLVQTSLIPQSIWENPYSESWKAITPRMRSRVLSRNVLLDLASEFKLFSDQPELSPGAIVKRMERSISFAVNANLQSGPLSGQDDPSALELRIGFVSQNRELARQVASRLVDSVLTVDLNSQVSSAEETVRFMRGQVVTAEQELARHQRAVMSFISENNDSLPTSAVLLGAQVVQIERELFEAQRRLSSPMSSVEQSNLKNELAALKVQLEVMKQTHTQNHPDVKLIRSRMSAIEETMRDETNPPGGDQAGKFLLVFEQRLRQQLKEVKVQLARAPETALALQELERGKSNAEKHLESLQEKLDTAERGLVMVRLQHGNHLRVVDYPSVAEEPSWPNYPAIASIGIGASLLLSCSVAVGMEGLQNTVRRNADIIEALNRNVIVSIPLIRTKRDAGRQLARRFATVGLFVSCFAAMFLAASLASHQMSANGAWVSFRVNLMEKL